MKKRANAKRVFAMLSAVMLLVLFPLSVQAVTPSSEEYTVSMQETYDVFIGNETPVTLGKGKEVYFVYTVESVDAKTTTSYQHGIVASDNIKERYMYENGGILKYSNTSGLLEVGSTYFLKFTATDAGIECIAVRDDGKTREVVDFPEVYGDATDTYSHVGIWFGCGNVTAELSHVLCYDENGKDLGVYSTTATVPPSKPFQYDTKVQEAYDITADGAINVALYNLRPTDADVIYMEYTVESSESKLYQTGAFTTTKPEQHYPHENGFLAHENFTENLGNGYLLMPGASYIVKMTKGEKAFNVQVQRTINGEHEVHSFAGAYRTYDPQAPYVGLWFGEGPSYPATFRMVNVKCYDEEGNSLGIACNQNSVGLEPKGEKPDYTGCESLYFSKEDNALIALYSDKTVKVIKNGKTTEGTYKIWDSTLFLAVDGEEYTYEYSYQRFFTDSVAYNRLGTYHVSFETGTDEVIEKQIINQGSEYMASKPQDPVREGATFEGWVLSDGTEYDFDSIVSESITLYAKWSDGVTYESVDVASAFELTPMITIICSVAILVIAVVVGVIIVRCGGKKNADKEEKINR